MAEEKKTPAKVEESKLTKVLNWIKKLPGRIAKPFKNMVAELKKYCPFCKKHTSHRETK